VIDSTSLISYPSLGRGLWAMGSPLTQSRKLFAALNNCAFVSTVNLVTSPTDPFCFLMDAAMLGVGVGFDTLGANTVRIRTLSSSSSGRHVDSITYTVPDSREGWVESLRILLDAYLNPQSTQTSIPTFNYHLIRPAGIPIKGFGGTSQGPGILREMHETISSLLEASSGQLISVTLIVDIMNLIGKCVVSGNIRRTAEIAFGDPLSDEYISLKDYKVNPQREAYGWTSNNSVFAELGMDYQKVCEKVAFNGEVQSLSLSFLVIPSLTLTLSPCSLDLLG
jgi:ribonucleoside-triphosphate reductase (thioredoxin)